MDFVEKLQNLAGRIPKTLDHIKTEEATKTALVMPFLSALGYDVFDPSEVIPEFTADFGAKKGEKVDYALKKDDQIIVLIECKAVDADLNNIHASQLYRYFSVTDARFGVLTNGIVYRFYSDIEAQNKMDDIPFFEFNLLNFDDRAVHELKRFTKPAFELDSILYTASALKYTGAIKRIFNAEIIEPTEDFSRFFVAQVYTGRITQQIMDRFKPIVKDALNQVLREKVNDRLKTALDVGQEEAQATEEPEEEIQEEPTIVTTPEEIDAYNIVRALVREIVDVSRVTMRDTKSYCGVLLDDNNRKPVCRLHFNYSQKYIGLFTNKVEERIPIQELNDLFDHSERLKTTVKEYLGEASEDNTVL
jgi:hypothetical protein